MRKVLFATTALIALAAVTPAKAEFILADNVFEDLGHTGFGNFPRLLTLQERPNESGAVVSVGGTQTFLNNITIGAAPTFTVSGTPCGTGQLGAVHDRPGSKPVQSRQRHGAVDQRRSSRRRPRH